MRPIWCYSRHNWSTIKCVGMPRVGWLKEIDVNMKKRSDIAPPHFPNIKGEAVINYDDYNGRAVIGVGGAQFETKWSGSSDDSIIAYNDPSGIRGIALAPDVSEPHEVTSASLAKLNYTSRTRRPNEGEVIVFENTAGRFLAVKVVDVLAKGHGDSEDRLTIRYAVVPLADDSESRAEIIQLTHSLEAEIQCLRPSVAAASPAFGGIGHNNPPEPTPLDADECDSVIKELQTVRHEISQDIVDHSALVRSTERLKDWAIKIAAWVGRKIDLASDEFAKQVGKTLGDGKILIAGWLAVSGRLDQLVAMLSGWTGF